MAPQLVAVEAAAEPEPEPEPVAVAPGSAGARRRSRRCRCPRSPQEWNVWEIERLARARSGVDPVRDEEWGYLLIYLREFASPDGALSTDFDALVRESFGELIAGRAR